MQSVFDWFRKKYQGVDYNLGHLLKSLTYFEDAEREGDLVMLQELPWSKVKVFFEKEAVKIVQSV